MNPTTSSSFGVDFGQKVDLTASIRNILRNYPEGTSILKELVQNADDAGAKVISFCLDKRYHPANKIASPSLAEFQGPALLVYNNACFTENDFQSIQRIGDSLKKTDEQKSKIGRFGIGFNSVYHLTDLPSFVSSSYLVMLDPQAKFLPDVNPSNPGKMVNFVSNRDIVATLSDQFRPYEAYGINWSRPFNGTLFRLPLRTPTQANTSLLSKRTITPDDAESLLMSLQKEASAMLLFLKSVERIEIKVWSSNDQTQPEILFSCQISNITQTLERYRSFVGDAIQFTNSNAAVAAVPTAATATTTTTGGGKVRSQSTPPQVRVEIADYTLKIHCQQLGEGEFEETWEVCNQLGGGGCSTIAADPNNSLLRLVPWGGVAAFVSSTFQRRESSPNYQTGGLAYCFLPLPVQTGLPIMVNGFFELSSNRRDVWQAGVDMEGDGRTRAEWNISLMKDIISPSYVRLLLRLRNTLGFTEHFQSLWPSFSLTAPWSTVSQTTLQAVRTEKLLRLHNVRVQQILPPTPSPQAQMGGEKSSSKSFFSRKSQVTTPGSAPAPAPAPPPQNSPSTNVDDSWIECRLAVLLPDVDNFINDEEIVILCQTLINTQHSVVVCTQSFKQNLIKSKTCELIATPDYTRNALRIRNVTNSQYYPIRTECRFLLRYCLSDLNKTNPTMDLNLLPLLPLADENIGVLRMISQRTYQNSLELISMRFSVSQARYALSRTNNDVAQACELLMTANPSTLVNDPASSIYVVCNDELQRIFKSASKTLVHTASLGVSEVEFLTSTQMAMYSNVCPFSPELLPDLFRQILPNECFQNEPIPIVALGSSQQDVLAFLKEFWPYASLHPELITASVEGAAIVPTRDGKLLPLSRLSHIITQQRADIAIPSDILDIIEMLGGHILDQSFIISSSMPQVFWEYVASSSRSGVLSILDSLSRQKNITKLEKNNFESLLPHHRQQLFSFLSSFEPVTTLTANEAKVVKKLPIFQRKNGGEFILLDFDKSRYAALRNSDRLSSELFPLHYLNFASPQELQLLAFLGVSILQRSQYFAIEFLPHASELHEQLPDLVELDLFEMMTELVSLIDEDKKISTVLKESKCVPNGKLNDTTKRTLHRPAELFDPMEPELYALLDETFFPAPAFQREDVLVHLRTTGLNTTLDWTGILACAKSIESIPSTPYQGVNVISIRQKRGSFLLDYLTKNISRLLGEEKKVEPRRSIFSLKGLFGAEKPIIDISSIEDNLKQLSNISWIPIHQFPLDQFMPWCDSLTVSDVAPPRMCRPVSDAWMCSSSMCLALNQVHSNALIKALGWSEIIPIKVIAIQLKELANKYIQNTDPETTINVADIQLARERITALIPLLYQRLNAANHDEVAVIQSVLNSHSWIWVGHAFVHPNKVAYNSTLSLAPYLYGIPQDLAVYRRLLDMFGIKQSFTARDYVEVLRQMAMETHVITQQETSTSNKKPISVAVPLSDENIDLAVSLVTYLSAEGGGGGGDGFRPLDHVIYVPDNLGKLSIATDLVTDDVPWLTGAEYNNARSGIRLCHPHIAAKVANRVGVRSLRLLLVDRTVDTLFTNNDHQVEAFGQAESLTGRLRTILDMYPDGNPILAELIQNADDAGATTIRIMIDENSYPAESLMDPTVAPLQGPALIFCNDSKFNESDFRSLARIGQGSKLEKLSTTGRFGLGFNSVYHITDTPSFVSGEHLVIFDPHTHFIPGTTPSQPGLRMKFLGNSLKNTFPDQFRPYQYFGCDFENSYNGTLFRFPLRTPSLARKSEISKRSYSIQDVNHLLDNLTAHLANHLIFLRSVTTIELYRCCEGGVPSLIQRATSHVSNMAAYNDQSLLYQFDKKFSLDRQNSGGTSSNPPISRDAFYTQLASTPDHKLPAATYIVRIQTEVVDQMESSMETKNDSQQQLSNSIEYLVVTGIRGGKAKLMACDSRTRHMKLVPMGSIAACLSKTPDQSLTKQGTYPELEGLAFCFLPLPVKTNLPVHINAYFELSSNRRDIWRGDDTTGESKVRGEWNTRLMEDVLAPLYVLLLTKLVNQLKKNQKQEQQKLSSNEYSNLRSSRNGIYSLIPSAATSMPWNIIRQTVFSQLKEIELLWSNSNGGRYLSVDKAIILADSRIRTDPSSLSLSSSSSSSSTSSTSNENYEPVEVMDRLEDILILEDLPLAIVPPILFKSLLESNVISGVVNPSYVRKHYKVRGIHRSIAPPNVHNAVFLLEYCLRDNPLPADLHGLPLMPMVDPDSLGFIGDQTEPPLFVASDYERRLLGNVGQKIIANDQILGNRIAMAIRSPLFTENCNVQNLTPLMTLKLLQNVVPSHWFSSGTSIVNRFEIVNGVAKELVSLDWVQGIWGYILETKCLHLFEKVLPIVPVIQPPNLPKGSYLVKFSYGIPILHMSLKDTLTADTFRGLSGLGLYVIDPTALGSPAYSQELSQILCEPSPKGILFSLCAVKDRIPTISSSWNENTRDAFRHLLLDTILMKIDGLSQEEIDMTQTLPIFEQYSVVVNKTSTERSFTSLKQTSGDLLCIPPRNIMNEELFDHHFVKIRNDRDRSLYAMMGLKEPSSSIFYSINVIPSISHGLYSESTLSTLSVELLRLLPTLENETPGFTEQLRGCQFVKSAKGQFCRPDMLYDPHAPYLTSILPHDAFPCPKLYRDDGTLLASLRLIGLCTNLTSAGILRAAESIHREFESIKEEEELTKVNSGMSLPGNVPRATPPHSERNEIIPRALQRAVNLIKYLDLNFDTLMLSASTELAQKLKDLIWIPVCTEPPSSSRIATFDPPWPEALHRHPLARPSQCSLSENIWICSTTHRIIKSEPQSTSLIKFLGLDSPISGRCVTSQLLFLISMYNSSRNSDKFSEACYKIIPRIYSTLMYSSENETDVEFEIWSRALKGKPFVWTSGMFIEPNRVSFTPLSSINTEPYLFVAKGELLSYRPFLLQLGVKEAFDVTDLTSLLRDLSSTYNSSPLPSEKVDMCLGIVKIIVRLLIGEEENSETKKTDSDDDDDNVEVAHESTNKIEELRKRKEAMGDVYLPDKHNVLTLAKHLSFDDAPWISNQLTTRGIRFVHRLIDNEAALLLGVQSLREQLFSGDAIVCPDASVIREVIGSDSIENSLGDLIGLADKLGSSAIHIVLDDQTHPCESLIHPGLSAAQGTSILVFIEGVTLTIESLTQLMVSPAHLPELPQNLSSNAPSSNGVDCVYHSVGKRLYAAFALTDCLQVLSGNQFYVFDPCGNYLIGVGDERENIQYRSKYTVGNRSQSKAQRYSLIGKDNQTVFARFPDQFDGLLSLPLCGSWSSSFEASKNIGGTILRLPLRKDPSPISSNVLSNDGLLLGLKNIIGRIEGSLLFSHYLQAASVQRCQLISSQATTQHEYIGLRLNNADDIHFARRKTIGDTSWKKTGSIFSWKTQATTAEVSYRALLDYNYITRGGIIPWFGNIETPSSHSESKSNESNDVTTRWQTEWLTRCLQGVEANRALANREPYKRLDLQPFISISAPIFTPSQLQELMVDRKFFGGISRYIYCNSGTLGGSTGLPFHIDGSFLMNMSIRGLCLPNSEKINRTQTKSKSVQVIPLDLLQQWNRGLFVAAVENLAPLLLLDIRDHFMRTNTNRENNQYLRAFYLYWPFISRIDPHLSSDSNLIRMLASKEFFLTRNGFEPLGNLFLSDSPFSDATSAYLQSCLPYCDIPSQVTKDLILSEIKINKLSPSKLRELLKSSGQAKVHCGKLNGKYEIVLPLLRYCLSDIENNSSDGDFVRRNTYRDLAGCPLLFMADRQIRCFPTNPREQVIIAPNTILAVLPALKSMVLHPRLTHDVEILHNNALFKNTLHIMDLSPNFIKENSQYFLPSSWERCHAIEWSSCIVVGKENSASSTSNRMRNNRELEVTDLLIYVLWRDVLHRCQVDELSQISTLPLLPVIAGDLRILMTPSIAPYLLSIASITSTQENERAQLRREAGRYKSLIEQDIQLLANQTAASSSSPDKEFLEEYGRGLFDYPPTTLQTENSTLPVENNPPSAPPTTEVGNERIFDTFSSQILGEALRILQMPLIDGGIFEDMPVVVSSSARTGERLHSGHKILRCLSFIESEHMVLYHANSGTLVENGPLLRFTELTAPHRKSLLLEFLVAHRQRRLTEVEINQLKILPLFTSNEGAVVAIASCNGVYWCESRSALASLSNIYNRENQSENSPALTIPTVLISDPDLRDLYNLIGAEELTDITVVKKFTIPSLDRLDGLDRLRIMTNLSSQWDIYRGDQQILQLLKTVSFVPAYFDSMSDGGFTESKDSDLFDFTRPMRKPNQLFSWTNRELLTALAGSQQNEYFPPPSLRTQPLHTMMVDLGMPLELDKESLIRIATDIQKTANKFRVDQNEDAISMPGGPRDRGMALLRYLKDGDRAALLFDMNLARRLGKISFVPVLIPSGVESGGFVVYKPDICRFEQTLAGSKGFLGFTCLPVLSEDLSPPQTYYSALGITSSPTIEVVLRHLRNLTNSGENLDRWNSIQYSIRDTFGEIFTYLDDNWKSISPTIQTTFATTSIVPIGNSLFKPRRLFFRLAEDLNPFMHEIPRYFGQHESFLKKLGVREKPSSEDYSQFLIELSTECRETGLNPNELRAIIAIIEAINAEVEVEGISPESNKNSVFIPDEDSILRNSSKCLYNNDGWLRGRLGADGFGGELYILHPFISKSIAQNLNIPLLSDVLVECLPKALVLQINDSFNQQKGAMETAIKSVEFIGMMTNLCFRSKGDSDMLERNRNENNSNPHYNGDLQSVLSWKLNHLTVVFVDYLFTEMIIMDPRQKSNQSQRSEPMPSLCFVKNNHEKEQTHTLYINISMLVPPVSVSVAIGVGLCRLLELDASISASISLLLNSIELGDSDRVITELRVASDLATIRERQRGLPGAIVTESDQKMAELKPFRVYRLGEIVAYEKEDLIHKSKSLHYARVVAISEEGEAGVRRISLKTDTGVVTCLPTDIFSFKSARETLSSLKNPTPNSEKKFRLPFFSESKKSFEEKNDQISSTPKTQTADNQSLVTQNDVVGALQSLLLRAGIPVSLENKDLVTRILELESEKKKLESVLNSERNLLNESQETIQRIKSMYSCQICLGTSVTHVMTPCGHTVCGECLGKMQSSKCPFCRSNITNRVKLFFSVDEEQDDFVS